MERANGDFKNMLYAQLKDVKKELNQWVSEFPHVQYYRNNGHPLVFAQLHIVWTLVVISVDGQEGRTQ